MRPLRQARALGKDTGILSVSYNYCIRKILEEAGFTDIFDDDNIVANRLLTDGDRAVGLTLDIYGKKAETLTDRFFRERGLRESDILYLGDSEDDEPVAELLPNGSFIVPFFAQSGFRKVMASKHKAFVPENEADLQRYLETK